ncbi:MAG: NAD(P)/FAD-dependent oxidoreductase [Simkaniaceae bacterium]
MAYTKVVVVGGGFGGLRVVQRLKKAEMDVFLVDKTNHHLFQPLLYQVASAALSPADIAVPLREIFRSHKNTTVMMGDVVDIDKEKRLIRLGNGDTLNYDYLVLAVGARHSYFGHDEWEALAPGLKTVKDALTIREHILMSFEKAERQDSVSKAAKYLNFIIIGAGPTGVEMAGAIAEIAYKTMFKNFRRINPKKSKIYLIEGAPRVLPPYPSSLSKRAKQDLEEMGVKVLTEKLVTDISDEGVRIGETLIEGHNVIWAAGNQASPLLRKLDIPLDRQGRALVEEDLSIPDYPEIFVIGDAASTKDKKGQILPGIAPVAIQMGSYVSKIIKNETPKEKRRKFNYFDKGSLATIGRLKAVGYFRGLKFTGFLAWVIWGGLHVAYLIGFRNRFSVMLEWFFHYITGTRGARLINRCIEEESKTDTPSNLTL